MKYEILSDCRIPGGVNRTAGDIIELNPDVANDMETIGLGYINGRIREASPDAVVTPEKKSKPAAAGKRIQLSAGPTA